MLLRYKSACMLHVKVFLFNPLQENTYLLYNEKKECIIIDPGCYYDEEKEAVAEFINEEKLKPVLLINTHCHLDHIFGNKFIAETYDLELYMHPLEKKMFDLAPSSGLMWNIPFDNYKGKINYIDLQQPIRLGEDELAILFVPGHSPGSVGFYSENQKFIISGDTLFQGSIGRSDLPGGDARQLEASIRNVLYALPDDVVVLPGHGPATTIGKEKKSNMYVRQ